MSDYSLQCAFFHESSPEKAHLNQLGFLTCSTFLNCKGEGKSMSRMHRRFMIKTISINLEKSLLGVNGLYFEMYGETAGLAGRYTF